MTVKTSDGRNNTFSLCTLFIILVESLVSPEECFWHSTRWLAKCGLLVEVWVAGGLVEAASGEWPFCTGLLSPHRVQGQTHWHP